ncbi:response regulator [Aminipila terrae]|uniref:Stage 0 sporulation protein A homolog n=1 Tax=Aminipila terrae TaxID=2697030 RepID=A0A6P1MA98_9FIRM|nr:response regulator [Aminipila terrae]QHI71619.1 response regulator [Aminipila terrae]
MTYRAIAIDDELASLNRFSRLIENEKRIELLDSFTVSGDALGFIENNSVDLIFLDIEMPDMNGIELAEKILSINPEVEIIFITAHESFALQAFHVYASGYLLKPVTCEDISNIINISIKRKNKKQLNEDVDNMLYVNSFGSVGCYVQRETQEGIKWRTSKCEELIIYLVEQNKAVSREKLIEDLWPDMSYDHAAKNLHVTCYNIRSELKLYNLEDVIVKRYGVYEINKNKVISDYWEFIDALNQTKGNKMDFENIDLLIKKYQLGYLNNKYYEWCNFVKEWMDIEVEKILYSILESCNNDNNFEKAIDILLKIISINDCDDNAYEQLIQMCMVTGNKRLAVRMLKNYKQMLGKEFCTKPPKWIFELLKNCDEGYGDFAVRSSKKRRVSK